MAIPLKKQLVRELSNPKGVIVTLTENGISLRVARNHKSIEIPWEIVIGSAAMLQGENKETMIRGCSTVLNALGYDRYLKRQETSSTDSDEKSEPS